MDGVELLRTAMGTAARLPAVTHEHPFGPEWEVFEVVGEVFLLATEVPGEPVVTLKGEPEHSRALQQRYEELVDELVRDSYELVVQGLPRAKRPTGASR